jgi:hypothetical protein
MPISADGPIASSANVSVASADGPLVILQPVDLMDSLLLSPSADCKIRYIFMYIYDGYL